ncbi:MAG: endopeptidase La [Salinivirgaceae bacterium]|nr:endopeptidase La [Salinivirgaceae bacterium]
MSFEKDFNIENIMLADGDSIDEGFLPIVPEGDHSDTKIDIPAELPILPLRNMVVFPGVMIPISVGREKSMELVKQTYRKGKIAGAVAQRDGNVEDPKPEDLYQYGTIVQIMKVLEMPDNTTTIIVQGKRRFTINKFLSEEPFFTADITIVDEILPGKKQLVEFEAITSSIRDLATKIIRLSPNLPNEAAFALKNIENTFFLINFVCVNSSISTETKQELLEESDVFNRSEKLLELLSREMQMVELKEDIQSKVRSELNKQQREFLLNQQIKTIQNELGGNPIEKDAQNFREKAKSKKWSKEIAEIFDKEVDKLQHLNTASGEYSIQISYLQTLLDLPWNEFTKDRFDLRRAEKILDSHHCGLEKVKERILEHLAVLKLKGNLKSPILCLYGPPGVGKTSLGKSIAEALGRKYVRMSLGGLHDEAEIRGHRRTYIGAMPGRIIENIRKAKSANPVFVLDEIDKVSNDYHGDPASALLEVLDPEQNSTFHDNYLDVDFDLSNVMFIATANNIASISAPLRDRMEMIEVSGYVLDEKMKIAENHLVPKQLEDNGMSGRKLQFQKEALAYLIENHTRESGVRELDKRIAEIMRKIAKDLVFKKAVPEILEISHIQDYLGAPRYSKDIYDDNRFAGVVTGLAWTAVGGEILFIETSLSRGNGGLTLTGNLGDVMKESATLAMGYIKAHTDKLGLKPDVFEKWNVHIHVPQGAIPKDGPSAGITMATSIASAFTQRKVRKALAMTGEITLSGKVLPVGGIREKILAAKRAGIKTVILCENNKKDIDEINPEYIKGLKFIYVSTVDEVLQNALLHEKVDGAIVIE